MWTAVANKNQTSFFKDSVLETVKGVELVTRSVPSIKSRINSSGWAQALENDGVFLDAIEQLRLTHQDFTSLPPHICFLICLVQSAARVHVVNNFFDKRGIEEKEPEPTVESKAVEVPPPADVLKFE